MKKKTKSKLNSTLFIFICLFTCGASLFCFFEDFYKTSIRNEEEIATIYFKKKIAQRKFSDSVVWERLQVNSALYNNDIIRTDAGASAVMYFTNGTSIDIGENTIIQISKNKKGESSLQVSSGSISVDTKDATGSTKIDLGNDVVIDLEKGSKITTNTQNEKKSFSIQQGSGNIINADGEESVVFAGESVNISKNGEHQKIPVTILNFSHEQTVLKFENESPQIDIKIKTEESAANKRIILESSADRTFTDIKEKLDFEPGTETLYLTGRTGDLYYRIYPEGDFENATGGKLIIVQATVPKLIAPITNSLIEIENLKANPEKATLPSRISFNWQVDAYTDYSKIEIYDTANPTSPIISENIHGTDYSLENPYEGNFSWKIIPHYSVDKNTFGTASETQIFTVARKHINENPTLLFPPNNSTFELNFSESNVLFAWKSDFKESDYIFEISTDENFDSKMFFSSESSERKTLNCSINDFPAGKYFWRIARKDGENYFYSNTYAFNVEAHIPGVTKLNYPPENFAVETDRLPLENFVWKLPSDLKESEILCILQFSTDGFEKNIQEFETSTTQINGINLPSGNYSWRVKILDNQKHVELSKTENRRLTVMNKLETPEFIYPKSTLTETITSDSILKFEYSPVSESDFYNFKIYDTQTNELVAKINNIQENKVEIKLSDYPLIKNKGKQIVLKCSVAAVAKRNENIPERISNPAEIELNLNIADKMQLFSPKMDSTIDGLTALHSPVKFDWAENKDAVQKEFILKKHFANGITKIVTSVKNPGTYVEQRRLSAGKYSWIVVAKTKEGLDLTSENESYFTILDVPPLASVKLKKPAEKFIIGPEYLAKNRKISFEWQKNKDATDYVFTLYQKNQNGTLRKIVSKQLKNNSYDYLNLEKLDIGNFEWHVVSYVHAQDGFEEQKSSVSKSTFAINFDLPETVQVIPPDEMYGN